MKSVANDIYLEHGWGQNAWEHTCSVKRKDVVGRCGMIWEGVGW